MGKKSTPKPPDYEAAAERSAESSREVTEQQTWANRPDQYTPWGSTTWENTQEWDPSTQQWLNKWSQNTQLTPEQQAALDSQQRLGLSRSLTGEYLTGRMQNEFADPMDWGGLVEMGGGVNAPGTEGLPGLDPTQRYYDQAGDALYNKWASRAMPAQQQQEEQLRTRLYNQGLREGDEAFDNELGKLRMSNSDAMQQAAFQATAGAGQEADRYLGMDARTRAQLFGERGTQFGQEMQSSQYDTQRRQQQLAEKMQQRGWSLNEINALLSGQQVGMPSMPSFQGATKSDSVDYTGAARDQYSAGMDASNARAAQAQGIMSGITGLAGAAMPLSDRRAKTEIKRIGTTDGGTPVYTFRYKTGGPTQIGVMADEVPHAAVRVDGLDHVDYSKVT